MFWYAVGKRCSCGNRVALMSRLTCIAILFSCCSAGGVCHAQDQIHDAAANIDRLLQRSWDRDGVTPSNLSGDAEFLRRVWLDLAGVAPPVSRVRQFLSDDDGQKRDRLID